MTNIIKRKAPRTFATNVNDMHRVATGKLKGKNITFKGLHIPSAQDQKHIRLLTTIASYIPNLKQHGTTSDARLVARELIKYLAANKRSLNKEHFEKARITVRKILNNLSESQKAELLNQFLNLRQTLVSTAARPARRTVASRSRTRVSTTRSPSRSARTKRATAKRTTAKRTTASVRKSTGSRTLARRKTTSRSVAARKTTSRTVAGRKTTTARTSVRRKAASTRRKTSVHTAASRRPSTTRTTAKRKSPSRSTAKRKTSRSSTAIKFKTTSNPKALAGLKMFLRQKYRQHQRRV